MERPIFIKDTLLRLFSNDIAEQVLRSNLIIQYLAKKTASVAKSSKSRASFANIYAIYVLVEDYLRIIKARKQYKGYEGVRFTDALARTRSLPWGEKLQNHALNSRLNEEFRKFFGSKTKEVPVIRNLSTKRYWINEKLLFAEIEGKKIDVSNVIMAIIDQYISLKESRYREIIALCNKYKKSKNVANACTFIESMLSEKADARLFEVVAYCILKFIYANKKLTLFRTGRTNANDGGIDFVLRPQGRFFQVTEVFNFDKYFLDIDKLLHYPITFVIKSELSSDEALKRIKKDASKKYDKKILARYLNSFEEVITLPMLRGYLEKIGKQDQVDVLMKEVVLQFKIEYNIRD
jgi:hypothetical protein